MKPLVCNLDKFNSSNVSFEIISYVIVTPLFDCEIVHGGSTSTTSKLMIADKTLCLKEIKSLTIGTLYGGTYHKKTKNQCEYCDICN